MKLFIATAAAALIGTAAFADTSTRYNDLRLDTSNSAQTTYSDGTQSEALPEASTRANDLRLSTADEDKSADGRMSTRSDVRTSGEGYIYGGFGPGNDSH
jgi:hypothetical protein